MASRNAQNALRRFVNLSIFSDSDADRSASIAAGWPADPFRPNLQLKTLLSSLSSHPNLTTEAVEAARAIKNDAFQKRVGRNFWNTSNVSNPALVSPRCEDPKASRYAIAL
jgi:hypothetical protein